MNLCGADEEHVVEHGREGISPRSMSTSYQCGEMSECVKMSNDIEFSPAASRLSAIASLDEDDTIDGSGGVSELNGKQPVKAALDSIQETLSSNDACTSSSVEVGVVGSIIGPQVKSQRSLSVSSSRDDTPTGRMAASGINMSPSPNLLNPLTSGKWIAEAGSVSTKLLCPVLDTTETSPSLEALMQRLQEGFGIRLIKANGVSLSGQGKVWLFLHEDRSRLCLEPAMGTNPSPNEKKPGEVDCWMEMPVDQILRLEIGGSSNNAKSFSIILQTEGDSLVYYDFEADNSIDREVVVTTIMLVLDQSHHAFGNQEDYDWTGGTMDQPIPCSPSLDPSLPNDSSLDKPIPCSPSLEEDFGRAQLSPKRRTQIFSSADNTETEASLVIHLEDLSVATGSVASRGWARRELPTAVLHQKSIDASCEPEDRRLDCKPSASSTQLGVSANNSTTVATTAWCQADSCAFALNDIADACTGIFALKQAEASCIPSLGIDQRVVVEEFIASALGAPNVVYTYLTEGGEIWNVESSGSMVEQKDATVSHNRASLLNAQAARLRGLRNEMTFAAALKQSKERMHFVQTVHSFDDAYTRSGGTQKLKAANEAANRFHSSALLDSVVGSMKVHTSTGASKDEEVLYYDSDPEDSRPRTMNQGPRQMAADRLNRESEDESLRQAPKALSGVGFENIGSGKKVSKKLDEDTIVEIVHAMNNERLTLLWHPTQAKANLRSSICVKVWIEAGVYLNDGTFLLPKLTWSKASSQDDPLKEPLKKLDLLDICRIRPTISVDRRLHPFALTQKSFYVETQNETFVFQAQTIAERDRIVYGLKLVIARLASLLMLRDIRAAEEFFGAIANMVPGEAPVWTKDGENESSTTTSLAGEGEF